MMIIVIMIMIMAMFFSGLAVAQLVKEAGFPPGVVNVVPGFVTIHPHPQPHPHPHVNNNIFINTTLITIANILININEVS